MKGVDCIKREDIAYKINDFFKEFDTYNYNDNICNKFDEEETIIQISNSLTDVSKIQETLAKFESFKIEALDNESFEEARELEKIIVDIKNYYETNKLEVLIVEPDSLPYEKTIINDLKSLQNEVDGLIEMVDIDSNVSIICNEEGKILNLNLNRIVGNDVIAGNFFIAGFNDSGDIMSLSKDQIEKYKKVYDQKSINELNDKLAKMMFERGGKELC